MSSPRPQQKNKRPDPQQKSPPPHPPPPPHPAPTPPSLPPPLQVICFAISSPAPARPPNTPTSFKLCKRFKALNASQSPSCERCVCNRRREGCAQPKPRSFRPCQIAFQHMIPGPTPPLLEAMPACFKAYESFPNPSCGHPPCLNWGGCAFLSRANLLQSFESLPNP